MELGQKWSKSKTARELIVEKNAMEGVKERRNIHGTYIFLKNTV